MATSQVTLKRFLERDTVTVARDLLGCQLRYQTAQGTLAGYIVETEAYLGQQDQAAHAYAGRRTKSNQALYAAAGTVYIYSIYGQFLLNVITQAVDVPQGVLIRGLEPCLGQNMMAANRGLTATTPQLTNGPGKLMQAFGIQDLTLNETLYNTGALSLDCQQRRWPQQIAASGRIGVPHKAKWTTAPLRFYVAGNAYVSKIAKRDCQPNQGWRQDEMKNEGQYGMD